MTPRALLLTASGAATIALAALFACSSTDAIPPPVNAPTPDAAVIDATRVATSSSTLGECPPNTLRLDGDPVDLTIPTSKGNPFSGMTAIDISNAATLYTSDAGSVYSVSVIVPPPDSGPDATAALVACTFDTCYGVAFASELTGHPLMPGQYDDAQNVRGARYPHAALTVSGNGKSCTVTAGSFTVKSIVVDAGVPTSFSATFVEQCDYTSAELRGCIRYSR